MNKIVVADEDNVQQIQYLDDNKFIFICTENKLYHMDTSNGKMYEATWENLEMLGEEHREMLEGLRGNIC